MNLVKAPTFIVTENKCFAKEIRRRVSIKTPGVHLFLYLENARYTGGLRITRNKLRGFLCNRITTYSFSVSSCNLGGIEDVVSV